MAAREAPIQEAFADEAFAAFGPELPRNVVTVCSFRGFLLMGSIRITIRATIRGLEYGP